MECRRRQFSKSATAWRGHALPMKPVTTSPVKKRLQKFKAQSVLNRFPRPTTAAGSDGAVTARVRLSPHRTMSAFGTKRTLPPC